MVIEREIRKLQLENGSVPFDDWYHKRTQQRDISTSIRLWKQWKQLKKK
ncbi:MAG: hypothetical protein WCT12_34875 [Verrucomicrobiota bacterium]